jgi:hypothetical protein
MKKNQYIKPALAIDNMVCLEMIAAQSNMLNDTSGSVNAELNTGTMGEGSGDDAAANARWGDLWEANEEEDELW